ncbi:MAG: uracil-DNA glycosylase family protein [Bacteroidia bacterium]|nr:uracil-DNA glycosylase family protein [Bacteroidia bacterium]
MDNLLREIQNCRVCEEFLPLGPKPIISASSKSRIVVIGQAPGRIVHETGIPWNDKSGDNLRAWMDVDKPTFYNSNKFALIPMGFCYPGKGKSGDLPPRPECAPLWHERLLDLMTNVRLILLIGQYSQKYYLRETAKSTLTETIHHFDTYLPRYFPLPHPSPRNNIWQAKNQWFAEKVLPELKIRVKSALL